MANTLTYTPTAPAALTSPEDLLTSKEVCALLRVGQRTLWRWVHTDHFPRPIILSAAQHRWRRSTVEAWIISRQAG